MRLIEAGDGTWEALRQALSTIDGALLSERAVSIAGIEWLPPVRRPSKIVCVVTNNRALDAIKVRAPTDHPAFFIKPSSALIGHLQPIEIHKSYGLTHPEPELAVVIGKTIKGASEQEAAAAVFGYSIVNDVTSVGLREEDSFSLQVFIPTEGHAEPQPTLVHTSYAGRYKGADTFAPMGPVLVTRDEIPDPSQLAIRCMVGDELIAADPLKNYIWSVAAALSHISRTTTLYPGDVVAMGTATGNSAERAAAGIPAVLKANLNGATKPVVISITGIGVLENPIHTLES
ncbi:fumarylacetoacetate hydrolase family protein [Sphingobium fuliginis]|nr:fumarylacetoacetate hydrolase family protein [Sphingobium fuliginis]